MNNIKFSVFWFNLEVIMSLIESLNSFFKDADIKNVNLEHVLHFIKAENGEDTILNEFWYDLLKKIL